MSKTHHSKLNMSSSKNASKKVSFSVCFLPSCSSLHLFQHEFLSLCLWASFHPQKRDIPIPTFHDFWRFFEVDNYLDVFFWLLEKNILTKIGQIIYVFPSLLKVHICQKYVKLACFSEGKSMGTEKESDIVGFLLRLFGQWLAKWWLKSMQMSLLWWHLTWVESHQNMFEV